MEYQKISRRSIWQKGKSISFNFYFRVITGENWEKVKNEKVRPFDITDLKPKDSSIKENNIENEEYFSIQITIPNGKERLLKISKNDDPEEIADSFCKIYGLKSEIKARLIKTINHFVNLYLKKEADDDSLLNNQDENQDFQEENSYQYNNESDEIPDN